MSGEGIVIVGGGHGGSQIAASLREKGYDGRLTLISADIDLPYQRPPLSKAYLKDRDHDLLPLRPESFYARNDIDLRLGTRVISLDLRDGVLSLADGGKLGFDRLALAPGARPRVPAIGGIDLDGVFYLRDAGDARMLRDRLHAAGSVVVVGGGFIGLEVAATARFLGKTVTVLEATGRLMGRAVAPEISQYFLALHRNWGSDVWLDAPIGRVVGHNGRVAAVEAVDGRRIDTQIVVIGIGVVPNIELATHAGLAVGNGIVVDDFMLASLPNVVGIGDCAFFRHWSSGRRIRLESVQNAVDQARIAAGTLLGDREAYRAVPWFWSDQGNVKLQMVGLPFGGTRSVIRGCVEDGAFSVFHYEGEKLLAIDSVNRAADHMVGRRLLGAGTMLPPEWASDESFDLKAFAAAEAPPLH